MDEPLAWVAWRVVISTQCRRIIVMSKVVIFDSFLNIVPYVVAFQDFFTVGVRFY